MRLGCGWRYARKREYDDFEKDVSWDFDSGPGNPAGGSGMRSAFVMSELKFYSGPGESSRGLAVGDVGTVSIVNIVTLSPRIEKLNSRS